MENSIKLVSDKEINLNKSISKIESIKELLAFGEVLTKSQLVPFKKAEDLLIAILYGREINISEMVAINNIYAINGRASVGVHIITGILLANGITINTIEDYVPRTKLVSAGMTVGNKTYDKDTTLTTGDFRTTIKFKRKLKQVDGTYEDYVWEQTCFLSDFAHLQDKDNWKNNPKTMLRTRTITIGANIGASDLIKGMVETTAMLDETTVDYKIVESKNGQQTFAELVPTPSVVEAIIETNTKKN